ncbi:MAG: hypothetical protein NC311_18280 [Muribaculaceae bacterium]|nr:hypothetical protein [Muribaculaceae bacterium]
MTQALLDKNAAMIEAAQGSGASPAGHPGTGETSVAQAAVETSDKLVGQTVAAERQTHEILHPDGGRRDTVPIGDLTGRKADAGQSRREALQAQSDNQGWKGTGGHGHDGHDTP